MPQKKQPVSYPPSPKTEAALRKAQYEKETLQDALWIVGGIFIALLFIGLASYIVRYVASRPSNTLVTGEIVGLAAPKDRPITGKLSPSRSHAKKATDPECQKLNGKIFRIKPEKSFTAYYRSSIGNYLSFELINAPDLANCAYDIILSQPQAHLAMSTYTQQHQLTNELVSSLPFSEDKLQSAQKPPADALIVEESPKSDSNSASH